MALRKKARFNELRSFFRTSTPQNGLPKPSFTVACEVPAVQSLLHDDPLWETPITQVRWDAVKHAAIDQYKGLYASICRYILRSFGTLDPDSAASRIPLDPLDIIIARAREDDASHASQVSSGCPDPENQYLDSLLKATIILQCGFCGAFEEGDVALFHLDNCPCRAIGAIMWGALPDSLETTPPCWYISSQVRQCALKVLESRHLSHDVPASEVRKLGKTFLCDWTKALPHPVTFLTAVSSHEIFGTTSFDMLYPGT